MNNFLMNLLPGGNTPNSPGPPIPWAPGANSPHPITIPVPPNMPSMPTSKFTKFWDSLLFGGWNKQTPSNIMKHSLFMGMTGPEWTNIINNFDQQDKLSRAMSNMRDTGQHVTGWWIPE